MATDDGGFVAVLEGHTAPGTSDATGETQDTNAAGPLTGELPTEDAADAGSSPDTTVGADVAAVIAAAIASAPANVVVAVPVATTMAGAIATTEAVAAAPPQPLAGLVPAVLDGDAAVAPAPGAVPATTTAATATTGETTETGTTPAVAATPPSTTPAPAAQLTLTLSRLDPAADGTTTPVAVAAAVATDEGAAPAVAPRPAGQDAAATVAKAADAPAPAVALATAGPAVPHTDPLDGLTRAGGMTTPHELARELGHRVQMAVREGGRELLINLRPPDLGHLTIRVTMTEGVMQAQIIADRPEAARLLQQSLQHLGSSLGDLGYSLDSLDVAYSGQDPRDAQSSSRGRGGAPAGPGSEGEGVTAVAAPSTHAVAGDPGRLDLLA